MCAVADRITPRFLDEKPFEHLCARLRLSRREAQIVESMFRVDKESAIARRLGMSPHTLRTHVERLYRKLRVNNRTELMIRLYESFLSLVSEPGSPLSPVCSRRTAGHCPFEH